MYTAAILWLYMKPFQLCRKQTYGHLKEKEVMQYYSLKQHGSKIHLETTSYLHSTFKIVYCYEFGIVPFVYLFGNQILVLNINNEAYNIYIYHKISKYYLISMHCMS